MPLLLRLLLLVLAGASLVGARRASQHSGPRPGAAHMVPGRAVLAMPMVSQR